MQQETRRASTVQDAAWGTVRPVPGTRRSGQHPQARPGRQRKALWLLPCPRPGPVAAQKPSAGTGGSAEYSVQKPRGQIRGPPGDKPSPVSRRFAPLPSRPVVEACGWGGALPPHWSAAQLHLALPGLFPLPSHQRNNPRRRRRRCPRPPAAAYPCGHDHAAPTRHPLYLRYWLRIRRRRARLSTRSSPCEAVSSRRPKGRSNRGHLSRPLI